MLYSNKNQTKTWEYDCKTDNWISSPYMGGQVVRNLLYEIYPLLESRSSHYSNGVTMPWF